jgi:hypothetical protein
MLFDVPWFQGKSKRIPAFLFTPPTGPKEFTGFYYAYNNDYQNNVFILAVNI